MGSDEHDKDRDREENYRTIWERESPLSVSLDTAFDVLADSKRRQVLEYLDFEDASASLDTLAKYVARRQTNPGCSAVSAETIDSMRTDLHHTHVPKLAQCGMVDYDEDADRVELTDTGREVIEFFSE